MEATVALDKFKAGQVSCEHCGRAFRYGELTARQLVSGIGDEKPQGAVFQCRGCKNGIELSFT